MTKSKKILLISIGLLFILRLFLPKIIKTYLNNKLSDLDGYYGEIKNINLDLYRGAYIINDLTLYKDSYKSKPLIHIKEIDLSIEWKAIFKGHLVGEIHFTEPIINLVNSTSKDEDKNNFTGIENSGISKILKDFFPLKINRFSTNNGSISYKDLNSSPVIDIALTNVNSNIENITNSKELSSNKVAKYDFEGLFMKNSTLTLSGSFNPNNDSITLELNTKLEELSLEELNPIFIKYFNIDAEEGVLNFYSEIECDKGKLSGYIKPLIKNSSFFSLEKNDKEDKFFKKAWEGLLNVFSKSVENNSEQQIGSKIDLEGNLNDLDYKAIKGILSLLENAFIKALKPGIESNLK